MATLIFRLRNVPEDEAEAVRQLLDEHHIDWYETTAGNWGIAMPGIWVSEDEYAEQARSLIENYQRRRQTEERARYLQQRQYGTAPTLSKQLIEHPYKTLGVVLFCLLIVYVMVNPFIELVRQSQP